MIYGRRHLIKSNRNFYLRDRHYLILFLAPAVIALLIFSIFPLIYSLKISFYNWDLIKPGSQGIFVGFENYKNIITSSDFLKSLVITLEFTAASVIVSMLVGVALAFFLYQDLKGASIVRTLIIAAMIMTPVVIGTAWRLMYNPGWGLINYFLDVIGIGGRPFLAQASTVIPAIVLVDVWQWSPLVMLIVLAGLQGLPVEMYEAAEVDGASQRQMFLHITIPLLKPALILALLIRVMDCFRVFDIIYAMTGGGPGAASQNLNILIYNTSFEFFKVSKGAVLSIISLIFIIIMGLSLVKILRREETETWQ
jgi:multiple sugar transport system permease protein